MRKGQWVSRRVWKTPFVWAWQVDLKGSSSGVLRAYRVQYISSVREIYDYCIYLQPPSLKGQDFMEAKWAKRDGIPPEEEIHKAIKDGLPEPMQHKLADKETDYRLMTEEQFNDTLTTIELNDERERAAFKVAQDEVKSAQANLRDTSEPRNGINANKRRKQKNNTNGRGTARFCSLCKNAGMPENKYMSHLDANCEDAEPCPVAWPTRISKYASTGKSRRLSSRSSTRWRARTRSS